MRRQVTEQRGYVDGTAFFDFGRAAYAQLELELDGRARDLAQVVISECAADGQVAYRPGWRTFKIDNFRLSPEQKLYRFHIPAHVGCYGDFPHIETPAEFGGEVAVFRYVQINHYYGPVTVRRLEFYNDVPETAAQFESSNPLLDEVWKFCQYSVLATSIFPCYVDGERERMPYEADALITALGHFCCGADYAIARRTIDHFFAHGDKTWPTEWHLCMPFLVQEYLLYSGDEESVRRWLPLLPSKTLPQFIRANGLLSPEGTVRDIIDWPEVDRDGYEFGEANFVPNAFCYGALRQVAQLTGDREYLRQAEELKRVIRRHLLREGIYVDSIGSRHTSLHTAMFALRFGLAETPEEVRRLRELVVQKRMSCSVYGAQFLLECCFGCGLDALGVELLTADDLRSWRNMLKKGSTITMEGWDDTVKPQQDWSHPWGSAPANLIPRWVAGVRPTAPGFARFVVQPSPAAPGSFRWRQPTPFGAVHVQLAEGRLQVRLEETERHLTDLGNGEYQVD